MNDLGSRAPISSYIFPGLPRRLQITGVTMQFIVEMVASHFNLEADQMLARTRKREILEPRQIAMYLCRRYTRRSLKQIGAFFANSEGPMDHATVAHACTRVEELEGLEERTKESLRILRIKIGVNVRYLEPYDLRVAKAGQVFKLCYQFEDPQRILYKHLETNGTVITGELYEDGKWSGRRDYPFWITQEGDVVWAEDDTQRIYYDEYNEKSV